MAMYGQGATGVELQSPDDEGSPLEERRGFQRLVRACDRLPVEVSRLRHRDGPERKKLHELLLVRGARFLDQLKRAGACSLQPILKATVLLRRDGQSRRSRDRRRGPDRRSEQRRRNGANELPSLHWFLQQASVCIAQ